MNNILDLSIVIPCFNEEEVLKESYSEIKVLVDQWMSTKLISNYQLVLVNNGSTDKTLEIMLELKDKDPKIKIVDLRNNFGYQSSISAGLYNADYDLIVSIDADLQDDPSKIKEMIEYNYEGFDMVLGVRNDRSTDSFFKRTFTTFFYKLMSLISSNSVNNHGDFRLLSRSLVEDLKKYPEKNRYLRGILLNLESKYECVYYDRRKRQAGETKFSGFRLISLALDAITSFSVAPIKLIFVSGVIMFITSIIASIVILCLYFFGNILIQGWTSTSLLILFVGGLNNLFMGILGEYMSKTYLETKLRPLYTVRKIYK